MNTLEETEKQLLALSLKDLSLLNLMIVTRMAELIIKQE